jgi:phytoene dehydrogenase-like protein
MAKILIIGAGVAGLSAGIYAQLSGHQAIVCEKHFVAGGNLTAWNRGGYHIDNCIHWLTGTNPVTPTYRMWETLGALGEIEVYQGESLFTCEHEGKRISLYRDLSRMKQEMLEISPEDEKEILSFIHAIEYLQGFCGIAGKEHNKKISLLDTVASVPALSRYYGLTTGELAKKFKHPLLSLFITGFFGYDFGALALIFVCAHFCGDNGGIPKGSSSAMAERMTERLLSLGGKLLLKKEAVKIHTKDKKASAVTFSDGSTIEADYIVLTADPASVFGNLLDLPMPEYLNKKYKNPRFLRFSAYHCAYSCRLSSLPFEGDLIFEIPEEYREQLLTDRLIVREFSHEKDFSPEGENLLQTLTFTFEKDAEDFITLRKCDREAYTERKKMLAAVTQQLLENRFPEMAGKLKCIDVWTPATYQRFTNAKIGSFMSFALPSRAFPLCTKNRVPGLSNVILATQWQQAPGGLPIAADVGRKAIRTITAQEHLRKKSTLK